MQWMIPSIIASLSCTVILALVYGYLFLEYRERHLFLWTLSWIVFVIRYSCMLILVSTGDNTLLLIVSQLASLFSGLLFLWGTYIFIGRTFPILWVSIAIADSLWIITASFLHFSFVELTLSTFILLAFAEIWTGICILRARVFSGPLKNLLGGLFIVWGLHKADYPFIRPIEWLAPWGFLLSALIAFGVALVMVLLYFQKNRLALLAGENRYRKLFEESNDAIFIVDFDGVIVDLNSMAAGMLGMTKEDLLSRRVMSLHPKEEESTSAMAFTHLLTHGSVHFESAFVKQGGDWIWVSINAKIIDFESKTIQAIVHNITERRMTMETLKQSERKYRALFGSMNEGVVIHKVDNGEISGNITDYFILDFNQSFKTITNFGDIIGRHGSEVYPPDVFEWFRVMIGRALVTRKIQFEEITFPSLGKDIQTSSFTISDSEVATVWDDITETRTLEEQLLQTQKMESIAQLAGGVAHDFNNMLSAIMGYSEMLKDNMSPDDPNLADVKDIITATQRAANLTSQLLAFSRKQVIQPKDLDLNVLIHDLRKMLKRLIVENIEFIVNPSPSLWIVRIDPGQFGQIITNLVVNARDAMPKGGILTIGTKNVEITGNDTAVAPGILPGCYVAVTVSDTGIGMAEDIIKHIFEPFYTTKEIGKGTGLGLSTCYGIVKQNNGFIHVDSSPGQGSVFTVYLPRIINTVQTVENHTEKERPQGGSETILVAEDEEPLKNMIVRALSSKGYTVLEASNGIEALAILDRTDTTFHMLITDVIMPKMGGIELVERARDLHPEIKILFMSGYTDNQENRIAQQASPLEFIQKPFSPFLLMKRVRTILDSHQSI